jgi:hypothetical protein
MAEDLEQQYEVLYNVTKELSETQDLLNTTATQLDEDQVRIQELEFDAMWSTYFPWNMIQVWNQNLTTENYADLATESTNFKKWLDLGPLFLREVLIKSPNDLTESRSREFVKLGGSAWGQVDADNKRAGVYRVVTKESIIEGEFYEALGWNGVRRDILADKYIVGIYEDNDWTTKEEFPY